MTELSFRAKVRLDNSARHSTLVTYLIERSAASTAAKGFKRMKNMGGPAHQEARTFGTRVNRRVGGTLCLALTLAACGGGGSDPQHRVLGAEIQPRDFGGVAQPEAMADHRAREQRTRAGVRVALVDQLAAQIGGELVV